MRVSTRPGPEGAVSAGTLSAWQSLALPGRLPGQLYLAGDTALAVQLRHRTSEDLRFVYHEHAVDLDRLARDLPMRMPFTESRLRPGCLCGAISGAALEFVHADETHPETLLEQTTRIAGLRLASLSDLTAMKLRRIADGGRLRDYFDLMEIDLRVIPLEQAVPLFVARYRLPRAGEPVVRLVNALGYLADAGDDDTLPIRRRTLTRWWVRRQARLVRELAERG